MVSAMRSPQPSAREKTVPGIMAAEPCQLIFTLPGVDPPRDRQAENRHKSVLHRR
jgi:hypothetical protein